MENVSIKRNVNIVTNSLNANRNQHIINAKNTITPIHKYQNNINTNQKNQQLDLTDAHTVSPLQFKNSERQI